jgi:hypothetical protein
MAKGDFETKPEGEGKIRPINFDLGNNKTHKIKIKRPQTGDVTEKEGIDGPFNDPGVDLNHPPEDTVIITSLNPTCGYYYWNGKWYYR